jgi:hypothetical protein
MPWRLFEEHALHIDAKMQPGPHRDTVLSIRGERASAAILALVHVSRIIIEIPILLWLGLSGRLFVHGCIVRSRNDTRLGACHTVIAAAFHQPPGLALCILSRIAPAPFTGIVRFRHSAVPIFSHIGSSAEQPICGNVPKTPEFVDHIRK